MQPIRSRLGLKSQVLPSVPLGDSPTPVEGLTTTEVGKGSVESIGRIWVICGRNIEREGSGETQGRRAWNDVGSLKRAEVEIL